MRHTVLVISFLSALLCCSLASAQQQISRYTYHSYDYDSDHTDTSLLFVEQLGPQLHITHPSEVAHPIPGYATEQIYFDLAADSVYYQTTIDGERFFYTRPAGRTFITWDTQRVDSKTTRYVTVINSNRIELLFSTREGVDINPLPYYGKFSGVLQQMVRNGLVQIALAKSERLKERRQRLIPDDLGQRKSEREVGMLKRERLILTTHVFENEQICWGLEKPAYTTIPFDTTLHYAGGTLILKRIRLPKLPKHYQTFVELHQRSNGDAYDRTGSVFVIPNADLQELPSFLDGIMYHPDSLPTIVGKDGERYQGIVAGVSRLHKYMDHLGPDNSYPTYNPPIELMRFFTPFGVGHYNDRVKIDGLQWKDETYFKQEISDVYPAMSGDVIIGVFIGNYDRGGHIVSLDIKSYPNEHEWLIEEGGEENILPLINTCNVLEMAGQNYGKIFGSDSITVTFWASGAEERLLLRYISTGHGGWGGGDEFNPKENEIIIDGKKRFSHTPWRCDCARYREWNPVSGNFWNGISSSDLSRSGWCPGTATQPVYFDLTGLPRGNHTLTIAIPQGKPMEGGFSHWNVSTVLITE